MKFLFAALCLVFASCGFGFGAVNGPSREYTTSLLGGYYKDSGGDYVDNTGQGWSRSTIFAGLKQPSVGLLLGTRRGWSWTQFGGKITEGDNSDYHATAYYGPLALAVGYTTDQGNVDIPYGTMTLKSSASYHGWYLEPAAALLSLNKLYVGLVCAVIAGTTAVQLENRSVAMEADAAGIRPGVRIAMPLITFGPVTILLSAELRYLISSEVMLVTGGGSGPMSYGGPSSAFAVGFIL